MNIHAKVTSKGQVTIPKEVRDAEGIELGDTITFQRNSNGRIEIARTDTGLNSLRGIIHYDGPKLSSDDIVKIVRASREGKGYQVLQNIRKRAR